MHNLKNKEEQEFMIINKDIVDFPSKDEKSNLELKADTTSKGIVPIFMPLGHAPVANIFLKSGVFMPLAKGDSGELSLSKKTYEKIKGRTYSVDVEYVGYKCDLTKDFTIFLSVLEALHNEEKKQITIPEKDFLFLLGYGSKDLSTQNKETIRSRVLKMNSSSILIRINGFMGGDKEFEFPLINGFYMSESESYRFSFSRDFFSLYKFFSWRAFSKLDYGKVKTERAKALYIFYETRFFHKIKKTKLIMNKKNLSKVLLMEKRENKELNRVLKNAHEELIRVNQINDYLMDKKQIKVSINNKICR